MALKCSKNAARAERYLLTRGDRSLVKHELRDHRFHAVAGEHQDLRLKTIPVAPQTHFVKLAKLAQVVPADFRTPVERNTDQAENFIGPQRAQLEDRPHRVDRTAQVLRQGVATIGHADEHCANLADCRPGIGRREPGLCAQWSKRDQGKDTEESKLAHTPSVEVQPANVFGEGKNMPTPPSEQWPGPRASLATQG